MEALDTLAWPVGRLGEAMVALARHRGWPLRCSEAPACPAALVPDCPEALPRWLEAAADWLGLEAERVEVSYAAVPSLVSGAEPALLCLPGQEKPGFLVVLGCRRHRVLLLGPDRVVHRVSMALLCTACCHTVATPLQAEIEPILDAIGVSRRHRHRARRALLDERLRSVQFGTCWVLRLPSVASFWQQLRQAHLPQTLGGVLGAYALQYLCGILAWWLLGRGALDGRFEPAWLLVWGLLGVSMIPLRLWSTWAQGRLAFGGGGLLKTRLLAGTLRLPPEEIRHQGAGQCLGRVLEAEAVEGLALSGGLLALLAGVELVMAACVLLAGAGGWLPVGLLLGWLGLVGGLGWGMVCRRRDWTTVRLDMTHALVERLVGHRTRAALLAGWRQPESGRLLLTGLDLPTLGSTGWRQRVMAVPQFHDNHVFTGTLAFNLLMGHHWPPQPADLQAAEALCRALELGPLLDRMPAGLWQFVGETGWQLSHGERSRLYIARALLQGAPLLILDESFAALDPETLHCVHQCVLEHAPTLMVIAHP
jgi:ATP-binding cassette subfamily B protein